VLALFGFAAVIESERRTVEVAAAMDPDADDMDARARAGIGTAEAEAAEEAWGGKDDVIVDCV